jgi:hypothetical protein
MTLLAAALNPKFAQIPAFVPHPAFKSDYEALKAETDRILDAHGIPHPAFTPEPTPIYDSIYKGRHPSPHLELRFIEQLTKKYSQALHKVWEDA